MKLITAGLIWSVAVMGSIAADRPAAVSLWHGFEQRAFNTNGVEGGVVLPREAAPGHPWIWRTEFFGHEPQGDIALLSNGWHVVYIKISNLYGAPVAIEKMKVFQEGVEKAFGLAPRAVLEGFSRGGLYAFNYAATYPDRVAGLYLDAPVLDIRSWPGGKGKGKGAAREWKQCLDCYGLTEETAKTFAGNPLNRVEPVARAGIPIIAVCGDADDAVPFDENSGVLEKKYRALGATIKVILKPGIGHHPHSLKDPSPIVTFILRETYSRPGRK